MVGGEGAGRGGGSEQYARFIACAPEDASDVAGVWDDSSVAPPSALYKLALLLVHEAAGGDKALHAPARGSLLSLGRAR